jgi:hypothetical protein
MHRQSPSRLDSGSCRSRRLGLAGTADTHPWPGHPAPAWRRFLAQFQAVLVVLLLIARHTALPYEALAIFAVVLLNATMGHVQQSRAQAALAALRVMSADQAAVIPVGRMNQASTPVIRVTAPRASAAPYADSGAESSIRKRTLGGAQASLTSGSPWRSFHIT